MLGGRRMGTGLGIGVGLGVTLEYSKIHKSKLVGKKFLSAL